MIKITTTDAMSSELVFDDAVRYSPESYGIRIWTSTNKSKIIPWHRINMVVLYEGDDNND